MFLSRILHVIQNYSDPPSPSARSRGLHCATTAPQWQENGVKVALIAGSAYGRTSPVQTLSPILYLDLVFSAGSSIDIPADYSERAVYSVTSGLKLDGSDLEQHRLAVLAAGASITISANADARCVVVGGEPVGPRQKWWNFVSSRPERIEQAKQDWQAGRFDKVPGETEWIPLPVAAGNPDRSQQRSSPL